MKLSRRWGTRLVESARVGHPPSVRELDLAVVIAVIAIRVMEVVIHQIVDVVTVGDRLVAAVRTVLVFRAVCSTVVAIGAVCRVRGVGIEPVLIDMTAMK